MKRVIHPEQAAGKRIIGIGYWDYDAQILISLHGDELVVLRASLDYDGEIEIKHVNDDEFDWRKCSREDLLSLGIVSDQELEDLKAAEARHRKENEIARKRAEFVRLRRELGELNELPGDES